MPFQILSTLREGTGAPAKVGDKLVVHYKGTLADGGAVFDDSRERGHAFTFALGCNKVIRGWDEALVGATVASVQQAGRALGAPFEVIVVNDASTDRTAEVAAAAGARVVDANVRQISRSRNAGAAAARGDYLIFVDADTTVTDEVVRAAHDALEGGAVGGGCAIRFDDPVPRHSSTRL